MTDKPLKKALQLAQSQGRRLVMPLLGFPGLTMTNSTIKLAQQNYGEHFAVLNMLAQTFHPDAIFPLMDLAVEANALGRYTVFPKTDSPTVVKDTFVLEELNDARRINIAFDTRLLGYVETVKLLSLSLPDKVMRGAYVTGPYTLAALLMGSDVAAIATVLQPDDLDQVCRFTTEIIQGYVRLLIAAGAQIICILEPSAAMLGPQQFEQFSSSFVRHINDSCRYAGVSTIYHTCGNTMHILEKMAESGVDGISLDSPAAGINLPAAASRLPPGVAIIGNINPTGTILRGTPDEVEIQVSQLLQDMAPYPNFILSTGCDLPQETPLENIHAFMRAGRRHRMV